MTQSTVAIIILVITVFLFITDFVPDAIVAMLAALAMYGTGILTFEQAVSGFSSTTVMLIIGRMILSSAVVEVGLADRIGQLLLRIAGNREKRFLIVLFLLAVVTSPFFGGITIMTTLMPIAGRVAASSSISDGRPHRFERSFHDTI